MKRAEIDLSLIRPGDAIALLTGRQTIRGRAAQGPHGELCITVLGQPVVIARPTRNGSLVPLSGLRVVEHQPALW